MKFMDPGCDICCPPCKHEWQTQCNPRHVGDKCEIMRPEHSEHPELTGRQVGDKCEIMRPEHSEHPELTGSQVGNKWETNGRQV